MRSTLGTQKTVIASAQRTPPHPEGSRAPPFDHIGLSSAERHREGGEDVGEAGWVAAS